MIEKEGKFRQESLDSLRISPLTYDLFLKNYFLFIKRTL